MKVGCAMKKIFLLLIYITILFSITGCYNTSTNTTNEINNEEEKINIETIYADNEAINLFINEYNNINSPKITSEMLSKKHIGGRDRDNVVVVANDKLEIIIYDNYSLDNKYNMSVYVGYSAKDLNSDDYKELQDIKQQVETHSESIDKIVDDIIQPYCKDLDKYIVFIKDCLKDGENPPTAEELDDWCLNLSTYIYFAGGLCERLGIRDDIAKAVYKEMYHSVRSNLETGTIADKDSLAELQSQQEAIISSSYTRAYKIIKSKVENAQELLQSCKKVLSRRMSEAELTKISN